MCVLYVVNCAACVAAIYVTSLLFVASVDYVCLCSGMQTQVYVVRTPDIPLIFKPKVVHGARA